MFYQLHPAPTSATANYALNPKSDAGKYRKEDKFSQALHVFTILDGAPHEVIDLRLYHTDSRAYCAVWMRSVLGWEFNASGSGYAGGYGYHRGSAAAQSALENAGVTLSYDIAGRGDTAIEQALADIARDVCGVVGDVWCVKSYG